MKRILFVFSVVVLMMGANSALAATQTCAIITGGNAGPGRGVSPTYLANQDGRANEGCTVLITFNADGSITTTNPNPAPSYDNGRDDNMIGVVNNTGQAITSLQLSSATTDIFGFDGDGVCSGPGWTFSALGPNPNCASATDPTQYGPAGVTFTTINSYNGIVYFGNGGIAPNSSAFFSLEGAVTRDLQVSYPDPVLVLTKSGPATMNLGQSGTFGLDVQNTGGSDAWNVSLRDLLPHIATGGMCNLTPAILSAQVFGADGVTPVPGKGPLNQGNDYSLSYSAAPNCQLNITMLTAAGTIGPNQHLIINYQTQLDANSQNGATLTNVAGAIQWFNADSSTTSRKTYTGPLTDGTPGILDNQDAHTVTVALTGPAPDPLLVLTKSGPATMNLGQWGTFGLDVQNTGGSDAWNVSLRDLLPHIATGGMCNLTPAILSAQVFAADGVTPVPGKGPLYQGNDYSLSYSGGPNCQLNITVLTAAGTISPNQHLIIHYQTQLDANSQNGATLTNVAGAIQWFNADSSNASRKTYTGPLTDGTPGILDNQDAHTVTVAVSASDPLLVLTKSGPATMNLGQWGTFGLDVQNTGLSDAWNVSLRDLLPHIATGGMCNLTPAILSAQVFAADGVTPVPGKGPLNQGTDYSLSYTTAPNCQLNITMLTAAATIGPNQHLIINYQTQLDANSQNGATLTNVAGAIQWFNADSSITSRKTYTGPLTDGTPGILDNQDAHTVTVALSASDPVLVLTKSGPATMNLGQWGTFGLDVQNTGLRDAWNVSLRDLLPHIATGGMCDMTPAILSAQVFAADGVTPVPGKGPLNQGTDYSLSYTAAPDCQLNITMLTAAATIGPNQHLILRYRTQLDANTQNGATLTNIAGAIQWFNADSSNASRKTYTGPLTDGTPGILDNQDAHTVTAALTADPVLVLTKSGPATMNLGQWGNFGIDVQNTGLSDAWNVSLRDLLPHIATGGMCDLIPAILSAQVFAADGVTPVPGKGPLNQGTDYSLSYSAAPNCRLDITMLTAAATIGPNQHLILRYRTQLDTNTQNGATLTNIAGAIQWFNADSSNPSRKTYTGPLTDGTPSILDNQDAHTVTAALSSGYVFDKIVADLTSGVNPATTAAPGDKLRYTLRFRTTNQALSNFSIFDDMDALNAPADFAPGTLALVTVPSGADISATSSTGGTKGSGVIDIRNLSLPVNSEVLIQFDITLKPAIANGTVVTNQATLRLANGTTFAWSNDPNVNATADPTIPNGEAPTRVTIAVGAAQQVSISNQVTVVGGGPAVPGAQLEYLLHVVNNGAVPATNVVITDDLNGSQPGQLAYVNLSATMNGLAAGVSFAGSTITVNYAAVNGPLAPGAAVDVKFRATLNPSLAPGTVVTNTGVATWNNPIQTASASVSIVVGSLAGFGILSGSLWYDADFDGVQDSSERALTGWTVELYRDNQLLQSVQTDTNGAYRITGVEPNARVGVRPQLQSAQTSVGYELRFRAPGAGANTAMLGRAVSPFTNGLQRISDIIVPSGANVQGLNLPIHPNGVIYNSAARTPVAGVTLTLLDARSASLLPAGCFDDAAQQGQITLADGYYKFDINFSDPACPSGGDYLIGVTAPTGANYLAGYSQVIPPTSSASTAAFAVPTCPGSAADAIPSTALFCEAQPSAFAPAASVPPRSAGTTYYVHLMLDNSQMPGSSQIFNNHIPLDPLLLGSITISKTTPLVNVSRGQLVPYTITANNHSGLLFTDVSIVDRLPAGFSYVKGSALIDGVPTEPSVTGQSLNWNGLVIAGTQVRTVKLLVAVGAGATGGTFVNRAQVMNVATGNAMSVEATATVRLLPDPTFDCTDVMGKVFNDANRNGRQDEGEEGLPGVRVVTAQGLQATTDKYGRYHITCAITPNESRGSNFVLKLDDRTLPSGFRMTTDQVQIRRATSGKALQVNFGASIHRVVSIDLLDAAFEPGTTEIRDQWRPRLNLLLEELRKAPAVLRLSYVADTEDAALVKRRVEAFKRQLTGAWGAANPSYVLTIEPEVFWRRGAPAKQPQVRVPEKR